MALSPVVVTASGFAQEIQDAPASISIITREQLETEQFHDLARKHGAAIVYAVDDEEPTWPQIDEETSDFRYARLMSSREDEPTGMTGPELDAVADQVRTWAKRGEVFAYFISGAKVRNPAAAQALIAKLK